jgi:hypothetical protein
LIYVSGFRAKSVFPFVIVLAVGTVMALFWFTHAPLPWERSTELGTQPKASTNTWLEAREQEANRTVWAKEIVAEDCGRVFESLWDSVNKTTNKLGVLSDFRFKEIVMPDWSAVQHLPHDIEWRVGNGPGQTISWPQWKAYLQHIAREGWELENVEFRHNQFDTDAAGKPLTSRFYFAARLTNTERSERALLEGDLIVHWAINPAIYSQPVVRSLDASHLQVKSRNGQPFFEQVLNETIGPSDKTGLVDPLILYDLDGDGLSEIILAARNVIYRRRGDGRYEPEPLCRYPIQFMSTALIADFDGDGFADLLCANGRGLFLFKGDSHGRFQEPSRLVWAANPAFKNAMAMTCGDIAHTGHLDVFLGQYKVPTLGQIIRPHYYDANDSFPSYLLRNDGHGNFTDVTEASGLGSKRWRRTYSASLVDLDGDGHLDLVVVSDFAGLDLYKNDGKGHFKDITGEWIAEPRAFGMAGAFADFNVDGRLDLLMIGMPSPTVDRLQHMNLWRPYSTEDRQARPAMTYGNRLYLAQANGKFEQSALGNSIARSGWSWGCSAFDFDNDGFPDIYIANGLESKQSVRDYEGEFWLHDIFVDESVDDVTASRYFLKKFEGTRGSGWSYGGYEKNRLFLNQHGESFIEIGHLAGVSLEQDSRNVVTDDLDGDGRVDLVVTTFEVWPQPKQTLQVYKNTLSDSGHWVGFKFREDGNGSSPVGTSVTIHYDGRSATRQMVTGDSHRSQSATTLHFGLGKTDHVESAVIRWASGSSSTLKNLAANAYYDVRSKAE